MDLHMQWGVSRRGPLRLENSDFRVAGDLLILLLVKRVRTFSLLWNGSQTYWREEGDQNLAINLELLLFQTGISRRISTVTFSLHWL